LGRGQDGLRVGAIANPGGFYVAAYRNGVQALAPQRVATAEEAGALLAAANLAGGLAFGSGAAQLIGFTCVDSGPPDAVGLARLAAARGPAAAPPSPLYLRAPDAKLPAS
jgi:tRNA threonylcarbamoyladenosine biosynthesis protein TsaB